MDILTTLPADLETLWLRFDMDLEQWNYKHRSEQQVPILHVMCSLMGVNHFRYLTSIFTDSLLILANKFPPPP